MHLAEALVELAERGGDVGILHAAGAGACSWYELAVEVFDRAGVRCRVLPTTATASRALAPRPAYSVLGTERDDAPALPPWQDGPRRLSDREGGRGPMRLLVCGGAGFIGSNFVRVRVRDHGDEVVVLDKLTYAGPAREPRRTSSTSSSTARSRIRARRPRRWTAWTRSSTSPPRPTSTARSPSPTPSSVTHAVGTYVLLEAARARDVRYVQVSTDEVYGSIEEGSFTEESPLAPSSPYSATKAGADLLVSSYHHTYGVETLICRGSNNYGPFQYPEKLIPLMVLNALHGDQLPVYGDGMNVRNWLYVEDFARGIGHVARARRRRARSTTSAAPTSARTSRSSSASSSSPGADDELIEYVTDRPGHDRRYSLGSEKVRALGWEAQVRFADGLERTVAWYRDNPGGGSRSARATTASTTSASTGGRSASSPLALRTSRCFTTPRSAGPEGVLL